MNSLIDEDVVTMHLFWDIAIRPILQCLQPKTILEIGSDLGHTTEKLLSYCQQSDACLHVINPSPQYDTEEWSQRYGDTVTFHKELSLNALPLAPNGDLILIDGDHNWYTVFHELKLIEKRCKIGQRPFPVILLHDTDWPYGRRDSYRDPGNIPLAYLHDREKQGLCLSSRNLAGFGGLNSHLYHAVRENNLRNGVRTAIEDFIDESQLSLSFHNLPGFHGLGILVTDTCQEKSPELADFLQGLKVSPGIDRFIYLIEDHRLEGEISKLQGKQEFSKLEQQIKRLQEESRREVSEHAQTISRLKRLKQQVESLQEESRREVNEHAREVAELTQQIESLQEESRREAREHAREVAELTQQIESLQEESQREVNEHAREVAELTRKSQQKNNWQETYDSERHSSTEIVSGGNVSKGRWLVNCPLNQSDDAVTIIVLNRDGAEHLNNLFESFLKFNTHKPFEFIVVDHDSKDDSIKVLQKFSEKLPLYTVEFKENKSFAYSNNYAAKLAKTEYLLFLNNDIVFTSDVLSGLLSYLQTPEIGAVGAKLVYPEYDEKFPGQHQHVGIKFDLDCEYQFLRPFNLGAKSGELITPNAGIIHPATTAAVMACRTTDFFEIGGFCEDYFYGYEDVDICLKFLAQLSKYSVTACDIELIHDESSTRRKDEKGKQRERSLKNIHSFKRRFGSLLKQQIHLDRIENRHFWSDRRARVAFAVTEVGPDAKAGDYFTALELGAACVEKLDWDVIFLPKDKWYDLSGIDVLIAMVDGYDLTRIQKSEPCLVKVAWLRNWFDRWASHTWFYQYDIYLSSSKKAANFLAESAGVVSQVFPIATNEKRFTPEVIPNARYESDYCFTGSYWRAPRQIVSCLAPEKLAFSFALYGNGWNEIDGLAKYWRGFVRYEQLPSVYASTKIVLDDANHVTKSWASVNSRVFDALASSKLVLSNGREGVEALFGDLFPTYDSDDELTEKLSFFLGHEDERRKLVSTLREIVLEKHTYGRRASELSQILSDFVKLKLRICIKVPAPSWDVASQWGDYHFALALQRAFSKQGHATRIDLLPDWYAPSSFGDDVVLVLRGLSEYEPQPNHINIMWNISHPDKVGDEEYNAYDWVFVASSSYADRLKERLSVPVSALLQCTDPKYFYEDVQGSVPVHDLLFVGNSRKQYRKIVRDAISTGCDLSVYGALWQDIIPEHYIKGQYIDNSSLRQYYSKCKILLNDHWESMCDLGFLSNRLFDAGACGCFMISDAVEGASEVFGDSLITYQDPAELKSLIDYYSSNERARLQKSQEIKEIVLQHHTFEKRAEEIAAAIYQIKNEKAVSFPPVFSSLDKFAEFVS